VRGAPSTSTNETRQRGNLASVLLQRGRPEEALPVITRAIELDPADAMNQMILDQVRRATSRVGPSTDVDP
jgi:hypothetical protein